MAIAPGTRIGVYEVVALIGKGGMGEVYRAHDTRLNRDVALKVLPEAFSRDMERMARFEREAKVLASLNHPNIAAIYGLEESGPIRALVMELVEGPTVAERILTGAIPVEEALPIARQVADAVEYAHDKNVIHRDLKPANIKVTAEGTVKVLDFGLAKALSDEIAAEDMSNSPTLSLAATRQGVILGTAAYMSPEQARGKKVDRRTDVWAFGALLYEMLTGRQAFEAEDISLTLAAVMKSEPDWQALPRDLPLPLSTVLHRCLQKDPKQRLRDIGDVRLAMEGAFESHVAPQVDGALAANSHTTWRTAFVIGLCALLSGAGIAALGAWSLKSVPAPKPVSRTVINLPPGDQLNLDFPDVAISPDGIQIAYVATRSGVRQIYVRALDSLEAKPLADTAGASTPFFSPDGQSLGFFAAGKLKKISANGGASLGLSTTGTPRGASWPSGGMIAFSPGSASIEQISDNGGPVRPLTKMEKGDASHRWPDLLPGGRAVFFATSGANAQVVMQLLPAGERRVLAPAGTAPRYAASGHLLYAQGGNLMAAPFDFARLQVVGSAVPVVEGVSQDTNSGAAQYSVSASGTLLYVPGGPQGAQHLVWVTRNGKEQALPAPEHTYFYPRISPDGQHIALNVAEPDPQIWIYSLARDTLTRLTFSGSLNREPAWTPDGKRIAFLSNKDGQENIFWQLADGSGQPERLATSENRQPTGSFSPDGKLLAYAEVNPATGYDIWVLNVNDHKSQPFLRTSFSESTPVFSPDGRWLAYVSDESGRYEVYIQPYPGPGGKYQISSGGGNEPVWNPSGKELFYRNGDKMMAVDVTSQPAFFAGKPRMLFERAYVPPSLTAPLYDVSPDGQRFLMIKQDEQAAQLNQIVVVQNWFEELKRLVPTGTK